jgi:hypothetical protein
MLDFLKTMPDMTNTQEITMHEEAPKISMAQRIRNYKAANPDAPVKQVAEAVGTTAVYVYQVFASPLKKASKVKAAKNSGAVPAQEKPISKKEFQQIVEGNEVKTMVIEAQRNRIKDLETIIEYLENKVEQLNELKYA